MQDQRIKHAYFLAGFGSGFSRPDIQNVSVIESCLRCILFFLQPNSEALILFSKRHISYVVQSIGDQHPHPLIFWSLINGISTKHIAPHFLNSSAASGVQRGGWPGVMPPPRSSSKNIEFPIFNRSNYQFCGLSLSVSISQ